MKKEYGICCDPTSRYHVYNPTTRQSREISVTHKNEYPRAVSISLAFDPSKSPYYEIVCIRSTEHDIYSGGSYTFEIEVYDSKSHSWKVSLEAVITYPYTICSDRGVYWNNSIYWDSFGGWYYFDIRKNELKTLSFPQTTGVIDAGIDTNFCEHYLQESNGHLYLLKRFFGLGSFPVDMWELRAGNEWLFKCHHTLCEHHTLRESTYIDLLRLMVGSDGDKTCSLLIRHEDWKMRAYNFLHKSYEDVFDFKTHLDSVLCFQFGESFALV